MTETWRAVVDYHGVYEVSDQGRVRSIDRVTLDGRRLKGRVLRPSPHSDHYPLVTLWWGGVGKQHRVHTLVATAFHGPAPEGTECCHNNGDPTDCHAANLRWATHSENMADAVRHGTFNPRRLSARLTATQVREIRGSDLTQSELARVYGCTQANISFVRNRVTWGHVS